MPSGTRTAALTTLVLAATLTTPTLAPAHASAPSPDPGRAATSVTVTGNGFGHGRGMSQWGAYGRAKAGQSVSQILAFYYPGTTNSRVAGALRVLLSSSHARFVTVKPARRLRVHVVGGRTYKIGHRGSTAWRLVPRASRTTVQYRSHGRWHRYRNVPGTTTEFLSSAGKLVLVTRHGQRTFRGRIRSVERHAVNVVPLEAYVRGVVAAEMPASWSTAALQAQAVAARTYAWYARAHAGNRGYDICDTTACQVYGGVRSERPTTNAAVAATRERVLSAAGSVAFTEFSASNGGWTAGSTLDPTPETDPYDTAYRHWTATLDLNRLALSDHGAPTAVAVASRDDSGSQQEWGGRVQSLTVTYPDGFTRSITGEAFRGIYDLKSTWFNLS